MWPFTKKKHRSSEFALRFKSGAAFFEMQCKYGMTELKQNQGIVALVLDAKKEYGVSVPVKIEKDGRQLAIIKVAAEDGGFVVPAYTPTEKGEPLTPGDVVIWVPMSFVEKVSEAFGDPRAGWVGFIVAKVAPEMDMTNGPVKLLCRYD
jgi:hypothetical protein